ncbi:MAG: type II toxin-antitoxin system RelE/ParE family toxin [Candidatus Diapherotrites archaeon]
MPFVIIWSEQARKELSKLETKIADRIVSKIEYTNSLDLLRLEKVEGKPYFKYRVGTYRIFIERSLHDSVEIIHIEHRRNAYKK